MTLKNINVLVLLFFLIINTIKGDCEVCCEDCCNDCFNKENEDISAKGNESNKGEESYEEKSKKKSNNSLKNNSLMENNNLYNNQNNNLYNNQNNNLYNNQYNNLYNNQNNNLYNNQYNNLYNNQNNNLYNNQNNNLYNNQNNNLYNNQYNFQNNAPQNNRFITGETLGLENVGATCYMNATLQCLFHIKELSLYFLNWYYFNYGSYFFNPFYLSNKEKLFPQYMNLLCQVFYPDFNVNQKTYYAPHAFKDTISVLNPLFKGIQANDAKDLLQCILENLHKELKKATQVFQEYYHDERDEKASMQYFYDYFITQNQSPILKYIYGINRMEGKCLTCNTKKYNFQSYNLLYFPLKAAKEFVLSRKKNENKNFDEENYVLTLEDCFASNETVEHYTGNNQFFCNECKASRDHVSQTVLYTPPTVLAIVLNRGKANLDFQEKFKFGLDLDIKKYIYSPDIKHGKYYLIGMVVHSGESGMGGHFIAYCRMDKNADWYCYNDAFVNKVENIEEKFEVNSPYILFYHYDN